MSLYDLTDRINWEQASKLLGVSKNTFFRLVADGKIPKYGTENNGFYLRSEMLEYMRRSSKNRQERGKRQAKKK